MCHGRRTSALNLLIPKPLDGGLQNAEILPDLRTSANFSELPAAGSMPLPAWKLLKGRKGWPWKPESWNAMPMRVLGEVLRLELQSWHEMRSPVCQAEP